MHSALQSEIKRDLLPLCLLLFLTMTFLHKGFFPFGSSQVLSSEYTDTKTYFFPTRFFGFSTLQKGTIPLWNPHIYSGTPYVGTLQTAVFYPLNFPFLILPIQTAINWGIALHLFLSAAFTYYLLKYYGIGRFGATIGGIVYTFSAPQIMHIYAGHMNVLAAMVWTPLMFLFLDKLIKGGGLRYALLLSLTVAFQLLAGQPQYLFYSMIALLLYILYLLAWLRIEGTCWGRIWPKAYLFAISVALGLTLSAVQILPTAEMTKYSTRENLSYEWVSIFSFPPENLITFLIPDFFGDMLKVPYWGKNYLWEMTGYVGIMPLMLAGIAVFYSRNRVAWFFAGLAVVSVVLALGKYTPLLKFVYAYAPGFNLFRGNSKFIFLNALSLAVLAGFGADALAKRRGRLGRGFKLTIIGFVTLVMASLIFMSVAFDEAWFKTAINKVIYSGDLFNTPEPLMQGGFETLAAGSFERCSIWAAMLLLLGTAVLLLYSYGILKETAFAVAITTFVAFDLFSFGMRYMVTFDSKEVRWDEDVVRFLKQDREPFRVVAPDKEVNSGMVAGIETLNGYDTIMLKRYSEFINLSQGISPEEPALWVDIKSLNRFTNLLNAKYLVLPSGAWIDNPSLRPIFNNGYYRIYQDLNALPRAFVVHGAKVVRDRDAIFQELASPWFDQASYAVIEEGLEFQLKNPGGQSPIPRFVDYSPNKVIIDAYLTEPGLLVLGDAYYPGWKAFVDGRETKIYPANYVMRGVVVPEGRHTVEFHYSPDSFKIGAIVSLATLAFVTGFLVWGWRRR